MAICRSRTTAPARRLTRLEIFATGIKVVDVLMPLERGGKAREAASDSERFLSFQLQALVPLRAEGPLLVGSSPPWKCKADGRLLCDCKRTKVR